MSKASGGGEWGGWEVRRTKTGHVVETWSRATGEVTGRKVLIPFRDRVVDPHLNLDHVINDHGTTEAELLLNLSDYSGRDEPHLTQQQRRLGRVLRRGHVVR